MNYLFSDKWHDVPVYTAYPACRLVKVEYTILLARVALRDQRTIKPDWRKVWKFVAAEGLLNTQRKISSKREQAHLNSDFHVVIATGTQLRGFGEFTESADSSDSLSSMNSLGASAPLLCLGTRHPRCAEVMLFHEELTKPLVGLPSADACLEAIEELTTRAHGMTIDAWQAVSGYNFYSDLPPPDVARQLLCLTATHINDKLSVKQQRVAQSSPSLAKFPQVIYPVAAHRTGTNTAQGGPQMTRPKEPYREPVAAVIAAGDYVRTVVAPVLQSAKVKLHTVVDLEPYRAEYVRSKCGFRLAMTDWRASLAQPEVNTVIIASYHDSHAEIAAAALQAGKKVFVEKPPVVTREDLNLLLEAAERPGAFLEVGYNRRYTRFTRKAKELLQGASGPTTIVCVVKEVEIPDAHWYRWPKEGTRITGNICHWIDLSLYLLGSQRRAVEMTVTPQADRHPDEERGLNILFDDNSSVTIIATSRGDSTLGVQEFVEVRRDDLTVRIDDYRQMIATRGGQTLYKAQSLRDKGHQAMYREAASRMKSDKPANYTLPELRRSALLTIQATEMVRNNVRSIKLNV